jgi:glycosyltransferase involved in cell wall biosynthesis
MSPDFRRLTHRTKQAFKSSAPFWVQSRVLPNAIRTATGEPRAVHGDGIPLIAMVCTWMEEDIIFAAVRNAFALGAESVILLDNGSVDDTVAEAEAAGATHVLTFKTKSFDEAFKYRLINDYIEQLSRQHGSDRIWWMMMDADEFIRVPGDETLVEFLSHVDDRCRVVGARVLDHYPTPGVDVEQRADPLSAQPMCYEKLDHRCELWHNKHPVFLWSADKRRIIVEPGFHQLRCAFETIYEPPRSLILDHFPFRDETRCRERLVRLAERGSTALTAEMAADRHMHARLASLDAVYSGNYDEVIDYRTGRRGVDLSHWHDVVGAGFRANCATTRRDRIL